MRALLALPLSLALASPAPADMLDGADDPAFQSALTTLLSADDPVALKTLHDLAEAGNPAALVLLPFALEWVPLQGNLKEKNALRMVGGVRAQEAAAEAHGATALWDRGLIDLTSDPTTDLPERAAGLFALDEPGKATELLSEWVNRTGAQGDLPPQLLSDAFPAGLAGYALRSRLVSSTYSNYGGQLTTEDAFLLLSLMQEDNLAGWVAYVEILRFNPELFDIFGSPLAGTGLSAADTEARIEDARAADAAWIGLRHSSEPISKATATRAREVLTGRAELLPITHLCQAHCPDSISTCEAAAIAFPGVMTGYLEQNQPFADVLDPLAFAASDRGLVTMIPPTGNYPSWIANRATAESMDACYAALLSRRDGIDLGL